MKKLLTFILLITLLAGCNAGNNKQHSFPTESKSVVPPPCTNCFNQNYH